MTSGVAGLTAARQVADAVLYEGYLLYPYRASSAKNQVRWQFGVLGPVGAAEAGVGEGPSMSTEVVVLAAPSATVELCLRFLQVQSRDVQKVGAGGWASVDELEVGGTRWIPFHEAVPREVVLTPLQLDAASGRSQVTTQVLVPGDEEIEELSQDGRVVGRLVRRRWPLSATATATLRGGTDDRLCIVGVSVVNEAVWSPAQGTTRDEAARRSFIGTHLLLTVAGTTLVSLLDGPDWAAADTSACVQHRCWPVMIADDDGVDAVLVSPIVLGDHPTIAPESAGDLFDATEIDEILTLRVMTMTEQEKAEARGTDPRAAAILARCDAMSDEALGRLHGARRDTCHDTGANPLPDLPTYSEVPIYGEDVPWWDEGQDARAEPERDHVMVGEVVVRKGSRVLLRPTRRADAQDIFLAGMTALVTRVYFDVDGGTHLAVTLEDDPASDLYGATGRFYYFAPDEVEALPAREASG